MSRPTAGKPAMRVHPYCEWIMVEPASVIGYMCGNCSPCPFLDPKADSDCPCIPYARAFEAACSNPDTIRREEQMLRDTI
jgi:hypothetical protein